jgi:hypothetical protein
MSESDFLARLLGALVVLGAACWLCIYPVALVAAGLFLLVLVPQGNELVDANYHHLRFKTLFHGSLAAWALSAWYCSRRSHPRQYVRILLVERRAHGTNAGAQLVPRGRLDAAHGLGAMSRGPRAGHRARAPDLAVTTPYSCGAAPLQ